MIDRLIIPVIWDLVVIISLRYSFRGLRRSLHTRRHLLVSGQYDLLDESRQRIRLQRIVFVSLLIDLFLGLMGTAIVLVDGHALAVALAISAGPLLTIVAGLLGLLAYSDDRERSRKMPTPEEQTSSEVKR